MNTGYFYCPYVNLDGLTRRGDYIGPVETPEEETDEVDLEYDAQLAAEQEEYYEVQFPIEPLPYDVKEGF